MADINKFSKQIIDYAERMADVADAAKGNGVRKGSTGTRWLLLPAVGAGLYALATSGSFARRTKSVVQQAKARASDLPEDLLNRVRETPTTGQAGSRSTSGSRSGTPSSGRARKTTSNRRRSSARRAASTR